MKSKIMSKMRKLDKVLFCSLAKVLPPNEAGNEEQVFSCHTNVFSVCSPRFEFEVAVIVTRYFLC